MRLSVYVFRLGIAALGVSCQAPRPRPAIRPIPATFDSYRAAEQALPAIVEAYGRTGCAWFLDGRRADAGIAVQVRSLEDVRHIPEIRRAVLAQHALGFSVDATTLLWGSVIYVRSGALASGRAAPLTVSRIPSHAGMDRRQLATRLVPRRSRGLNIVHHRRPDARLSAAWAGRYSPAAKNIRSA